MEIKFKGHHRSLDGEGGFCPQLPNGGMQFLPVAISPCPVVE